MTILMWWMRLWERTIRNKENRRCAKKPRQDERGFFDALMEFMK